MPLRTTRLVYFLDCGKGVRCKAFDRCSIGSMRILPGGRDVGVDDRATEPTRPDGSPGRPPEGADWKTTLPSRPPRCAGRSVSQKKFPSDPIKFTQIAQEFTFCVHVVCWPVGRPSGSTMLVVLVGRAACQVDPAGRSAWPLGWRTRRVGRCGNEVRPPGEVPTRRAPRGRGQRRRSVCGDRSVTYRHGMDGCVGEDITRTSTPRPRGARKGNGCRSHLTAYSTRS